jgi:putative mRNA 3-end processing factor
LKVGIVISSLTIKFLGGSREVGRSAVSVRSNGTQILIDYGVMLDKDQPGFPMHVPPREVDAIFLTHAHLDHCGAMPVFFIGGRIPVYGTGVSFELARILISDLIHLTGYFLPYEYLDLDSMMSHRVDTDYGKPIRIGTMTAQLINGGHLPGSAQVLVEASGKRLLYTSDFNTVRTRLMDAADLSYGDLDAIIIESTYADEDHPERNGLEEEFVKRVTEVVERGGTALVPAFSVGRSQEILCVLAAHHFEYPVVLDGMARETTEILLRHPTYLSDPELLGDAMRMAELVKGWRDRRRAAGRPGVIVSPAGMLRGGPAAFYAQEVARDPLNAIYLVSYQIPGTPGHELLERRRILINGRAREVSAEVRRFDFSSHCGRKELMEAVRRLGSGTKVFVIHGAEENCQLFVDWATKEAGKEAVAPSSGDEFEV